MGALRAALEARGHQTRLVTKLESGERGVHGPDDRVRRCRKIIQEFRPDACHFHNTLAMGWSPLVAAKKESVRNLVWTMHDYRAVCPNTLLLRPDLNICDDLHWCGSCVALPKLPHYDLDRIRKKLQGVKIAAISDAQRRLVEPHLPVTATIHWDADAGLLAAPEAPDGKPLTVLFAGRKDVEKGFDFCLQAVKRLSGRHPGIRLHLAGRSRFGDERQRIDALGLGKQVIDHGALPHDRYLEMLRSVQVVVCASVWAEPFNLSLLEAMACGKPVIASRSGAHGELAGDGGAVLADPRSSASLMNAMETLFADADLRRDLARRAREQAARFTGCTEKYLRLYGE